MRASDEDRQRTVDELRRHCAAGRIDVDEYASRVERALSASTLEDLDEVRADLPLLRVPEPAAGGGVWARRNGPTASSLPVGSGSPHKGHHEEGYARADTRIVAFAVAAITVAVVLAAIVVGLVTQWAWALLLIAGWAVGLVQGRLGRRARRQG